ncbi:MAG: hypothetical protein HGB19_12345 [Chlorobiales bacterium]|nr:hypothetical protein [Chlorobiales bacterium]
MRLLIGKPSAKARIGVGVLSGTSLDGIDVGLVRLRGAGECTKAELLAFRTYPIPKVIREKILKNLHPEKATLPELSQLHFLIGDLFADAIQKLLDEENFPKEKPELYPSSTHISTTPEPCLAPSTEFREGHRIVLCAPSNSNWGPPSSWQSYRESTRLFPQYLPPTRRCYSYRLPDIP